MSEPDAHEAEESSAESDDGADAADGARPDDPGAGAGAATAEEATAEDEQSSEGDEPERGAADSDGDHESTDVDDSLVERVAESDPADVAHELASLRTRIDGLEGELDAKESEIEEITSKLKHKQADFQNYKKRMEQRREAEKQRAAEDLITRLLDVRDNLVRALDQDGDTDIRGGVESTLRQFDDVLERENVEAIEPEPGEDVDPHRHEVLVTVESGQPEDTIADVHRPGYEMADAVLREAQVTVSEGGE